MIVTRGLTKTYGPVKALHGLDLEVRAGELFGLLGPNGAGKTTLVRILTTLMRPDAGQVLIASHDVVSQPQAVRRLIGVVHQTPSLDPRSTVLENLDFHCKIYAVPKHERVDRIAAALRLGGLESVARRLAGSLSGGQKRRLEIVRALVHRPRVLILDEPTTGLDPAARHELWAFLIEMCRQEGLTVFFTTHYLDEAEPCDRIAVLDRGRLVYQGTAEGLRAAVPGDGSSLPRINLTEAYLHLTGSRTASVAVYHAPERGC